MSNDKSSLSYIFQLSTRNAATHRRVKPSGTRLEVERKLPGKQSETEAKNS